MTTNSQEEVMSNGFFSFSNPDKEGWLTKQGGIIKNWKKRWFTLQDNRLYYYKSPSERAPLGFIPLERCQTRVVNMSGKKNCLEIYDPQQPFSKHHPSFYIYADSVDELKEWQSKFASIQEINAPTASSEPKVEKEGWLTKRGGIVKNWKVRWFVLKSNVLYYYKERGDSEPLGFIPIDRASISTVDYKQFRRFFCFEITDPSTAFNRWHPSYFVQANSREEMLSWIDVIQNKRSSFLVENITRPISAPASSATLTELPSVPVASAPLPVLEIPSPWASPVNSPVTPHQTMNISLPMVADPVVQYTREQQLQIPLAIVEIIYFMDRNGTSGTEILNTPAVLQETDQKEMEILRKAVYKLQESTKSAFDEALEECSSSTLIILLLFELLEANYKDEPLVTCAYSKDFLNTHSDPDKDHQLQTLAQIVAALPQPIRFGLEFILAFIGRCQDRNQIQTSSSFKEEDSFLGTVTGGSFRQLVSLFAPFLLRTKKSLRLSHHPILTNKIEDQAGRLDSLLRDLELAEPAKARQEDEQELTCVVDILRKLIKDFDFVFLSSHESRNK